MNNLIASVSYLEFVNKISSLVNELLYSPDSGYILLKSKEAILGIDSLVKKFNSEAQKIEKEYSFSQNNSFVNQKRKDMLLLAQKHYQKEILNWIDEVFDSTIDNIFFDLSLDKNKANEYYKNLIEAVKWFSKAKNLDENDKKAIFKKYTIDFKNVLNSNENDILKSPAQKSDTKEFCRFWKMISSNLEEFINYDFSLSFEKLTQNDLKFFENIKIKLQNTKKNLILDEISLINTAFEFAKIKNNDEIYEFILQIYDDFKTKFEQNKTLNEEDKISLIKRRISLFQDKNKDSKEYFKNKLISLNE